MEKVILSISGWWVFGFILMAFVVIYLIGVIRMLIDPEFRFSQQIKIPYELVKEYKKAWDDIAAAGRKSGSGYDYQKSKEILSNLSDDTYWSFYSNWKHSLFTRKIQKKLDKGEWWKL